MPYIRPSRKGEEIIKDKAFVTLLGGVLPDEDTEITALLNDLDRLVRARSPKVSIGALSNSHGDWYEWLLAIQAWNCFVTSPNMDLAVLLPNVSRFSVANLYTPDLSELVQDLRTKVAETSQVQLITSNPDFVIINSSLARSVITDYSPITIITVFRLIII